ncbi:hypothetical protein SARC_06949 [Sphaeroforma arctica JP610]|uniref:Uncharacterized protein n=1 Tax=Sphaeroforma arctica JP610 TaxID=667725 RepID=A0A0L0FV27_9EUKA|nr:hypothetical protein SARC_06949 [Sphaeroforma arctica JP610]KNC80700.1 hypothetical protein SARC_06949 [Sphaeroforma arctica JP610]|eukprot:XP_014154602.1 hypothetical protein SARC_06949 [Sphaeroforma arctica JP610]
MPTSENTGDFYVCHFVDVASQYILLYPSKDKSTQTVAEATCPDTWLDEMATKIFVLWGDLRREYGSFWSEQGRSGHNAPSRLCFAKNKYQMLFFLYVEEAENLTMFEHMTYPLIPFGLSTACTTNPSTTEADIEGTKTSTIRKPSKSAQKPESLELYLNKVKAYIDRTQNTPAITPHSSANRMNTADETRFSIDIIHGINRLKDELETPRNETRSDMINKIIAKLEKDLEDRGE